MGRRELQGAHLRRSLELYDILYYIVLYYIILYCTILYQTRLDYILYYIILYYKWPLFQDSGLVLGPTYPGSGAWAGASRSPWSHEGSPFKYKKIAHNVKAFADIENYIDI